MKIIVNGYKIRVLEVMKLDKPPIGLVPKDIWKLRRLKDIKEAIERYLEDGREIPMEWISEFNQLLNEPKMSCIEKCGHSINACCVLDGCKYK